jgi:hypothetical protein
VLGKGIFSFGWKCNYYQIDKYLKQSERDRCIRNVCASFYAELCTEFKLKWKNVLCAFGSETFIVLGVSKNMENEISKEFLA